MVVTQADTATVQVEGVDWVWVGGGSPPSHERTVGHRVTHSAQARRGRGRGAAQHSHRPIGGGGMGGGERGDEGGMGQIGAWLGPRPRDLERRATAKAGALHSTGVWQRDRDMGQQTA